jgi:arylsulfatase A-like enzyme
MCGHFAPAWTGVVSRALALLAVALLAAGCQRSVPRPSIVLAVLDTTRADAVSAYAQVEGTTPTIDALANSGVVYEHAYSNANWTLPSHASLFTGLLPSQNGVRGGSNVLGALPTLADHLHKAGYETVGISENPWLTPKNPMAKRFERFEAADGEMVTHVQEWLRTRDGTRPFFLFLNIMDSHSPYKLREQNPYLPPGVTRAQAQEVLQVLAKGLDQYLCTATPDAHDMTVLHGLYLGNVRAADAKLGQVLAQLAPARKAAPTIVVVTSDHGEYFGEQSLIEHEVGVGNAVLHVPLVVDGLAHTAPARIDAPVQLVDLMPSILSWVGAPVPDGLSGEILPTTQPTAPRRKPIISEFHDYRLGDPLLPQGAREVEERKWRNCGPEDRVSGDMRALLDFPYKLISYTKYPAELYDVRADPREQRDLSKDAALKLVELQAELTDLLPTLAVRATAPKAHLDAAEVERLRALGYLGGPAADGQPNAPADAESSGPSTNPRGS